MMSSLGKLLHAVQLMVGNAMGDPEVKAFLEAMRFPLDRLAEGLGLSEAAQGSTVKREVSYGRQLTLTKSLGAVFAAIRGECTHLRYTLKTVLRERRDLLAKVGIFVGGPRKAEKAPGAANGTAEPTPQGATAPQVEGGRRKHSWETTERLLPGSRAMIQAVLEEPEILAAVTPFGYPKEALDGLLAGLGELERLDREQEAAKGMRQAATKDLVANGRRLRTWMMPWKRRLMVALRDKPEFRIRLGLSA